jgi:hypothetical protein
LKLSFNKSRENSLPARKAAKAAGNSEPRVMATMTSTSFSPPAIRREGRPELSSFKAFWRAFFAKAFDPYRPELHYMRGPGPAWRAKYGSDAEFRVK